MHMHHQTKLQIPVLRAPSAHSSSTNYEFHMLFNHTLQGDQTTLSDLRDAIREVIRRDHTLDSMRVVVKLHHLDEDLYPTNPKFGQVPSASRKVTDYYIDEHAYAIASNKPLRGMRNLERLIAVFEVLSPPSTFHTVESQEQNAFTAALRTVYEDAWGKPWPSKTCTITRTEVERPDRNALTIDADDSVSDVADQADFSDLPTQWSYTCLLHLDELMSTLHAFVHLPWRAPHILVVRDDYRFLMEELERLQGPYILTGQPGIGKTKLLLFILLDRLRRQLPTAVQFRRNGFILFDKDGPRVYSATADVRLSPECWALVDQNPMVSLPCEALLCSAARIIFASPPNESGWSQLCKENGFRIAIMDLPSLFEIAAIAKELHQEPAQAVTIARKWGPCIRTVLELLSPTGNSEYMYRHSATAAARRLCSNPFLVPPNLGDGLGSDLVFVHPIRPKLSPYGPAVLDYMVFWIPTPALAQLFNLERITASRDKLMMLYDAFSSRSYTRDRALWHFEKTMHVQLSLPGPPLEILGHDGSHETMQPARTLLIGTLAALRNADAPFYWFSSVAEPTGIDGVLVNPGHVYVLQAIPSQAERNGDADRDRDPTDGVRRVWNAFGPIVRVQYAWNFVVVTDEGAAARRYAAEFADRLREVRLGGACVQVRVWGCVLGPAA